MKSDAETFQPLGPAIERPKPQPAPPEWKPTGKPGFEVNPQGQLRHVPPKPAPER